MLNRNQRIGIGAVVAFFMALAFYFFYWIKTPVYSLNLAREAAQKHDVERFETYVDLDSLLPQAFDDSLAAYQEASGQKISDNPLAAGILQLVKPQVVSAMKEGIEKMVQGEKIEPQTNESGQVNQAQELAAGMSKGLLKKGLEVKDISTISRSDGNAVVSIKVHDGKIDGDYEFRLNMKQMENGKWKVKKVSNLKDTILTIDRLTKAKLAELNEPLREKIKEAVTIQDVKAEDGNDGNPFFTQYWIRYQADVQNCSKQEIRKLLIRFELKDKNGKLLRQENVRFNRRVIPAGVIRKLYYLDKLNPFIPEEVVLQGRGASQRLEAEITGVEFVDGTTINLLKEIPEETSNQ